FDKALIDAGVSINLMSLSIFKKLGLRKVKPTSITLQLTDRSITYSRGITKDVLVKVNNFIFLVDFVVLDIEEDRELLLIRGWSFLATERVVIDVHGGKLTLRVNENYSRSDAFAPGSYTGNKKIVNFLLPHEAHLQEE
ncbi:uncharacterized protein LOC111386462, partial [Olea europaea var. sylvestris]|uniref:uncharacterized protein LOC111386462 n=1 Tax=Olea europaea var. sylvestris TaxID=158386 RepID=UPI000C1D4669